MVVPVFVNGHGNDIVRQIGGNFTGKGGAVTIVFGKPVAFDGLLDGPPSADLHQQRLSDRALDAVRRLGGDERAIRAELPAR